uniref:Uncharacterized protein n=1 Tax=Arundo donax TaxID=35708 RepID=A0A0A9SV38_ARUDO
MLWSFTCCPFSENHTSKNFL